VAGEPGVAGERPIAERAPGTGNGAGEQEPLVSRSEQPTTVHKNGGAEPAGGATTRE
jgi:hypothetical protein